MCPITTLICEGIKLERRVNISLSAQQCIAIGEILGQFGFVNEMGENPLDLIQDRDVEELEQSIAAQRPE